MRETSDAEIASIPGAFWSPDTEIFRLLLGARSVAPGDLAELGTSFGASAILIGAFKSSDEVFTVVDLFEEEAPDEANEIENRHSYPGLTRQSFEQNYLQFHEDLPVIIQGSSETISQHARHGVHRFVHVDASHLYDHVCKDIAAAKVLLRSDGVLVLDDFRAEHTPGVAAAAWRAVLMDGLQLIVLSPNKMYATWGSPLPTQSLILDWASRVGIPYEMQLINGREVVRLTARPQPKYREHPLRKFFPEVLWSRLRRLR